MARRRLDGGWDIPQSALDIDRQDRLRGRVRMLNGALEGGMESSTLPLEVVPGASPQRVRRKF